MPMRIAMIGQKGMPAIHGGVERHVHDLAVRLVDAGHDVMAYTRKWYAPGGVRVEGVSVVQTMSLKTKHLDTLTHTLSSTIHAMRAGVDVIHYHGVGPSLLSFIPRLFTPRIRVVTTFHSIDRKHQKWGLIARTALRLGEWTACRFAHRTISVSQTIAQYARDVYDADTAYIPNGVPLKRTTTQKDFLRQYGLMPGKYIIMVSRLIPHKGAHYLIDAWKQLKAAKDPSVSGMKLVIVGDGHYTEAYVDRLHESAEEESSIIFTGFQSGMALKQLMSHAKLMVHPSDNEGLPIVVLEGMSYGLPMLVSDIIEHRELISNRTFRFTASSVSSLKRTLAKVLKLKKEELKSAGASNREVVKRGFTWNRIVQQIVRVYEDLLATDTVEDGVTAVA